MKLTAFVPFLLLASAAAAGQPIQDRQVLAFYYGWYGNPQVTGRWVHWQGVDVQRKQIANSTHYPVLGPYDSHDPKVVEQHCRWATEAGITGFIVSWWHRRDFHDQGLPLMLETASRFRLGITIYYETARSVESVLEDFRYLRDRYWSHPAWLRHRGRPVVFVYGRAISQIGLEGWQAVMEELARWDPKPVLIGDRLTAKAAQIFHGIHTYNITGQTAGMDPEALARWADGFYRRVVRLARQHRRIACVTVIPGYDDRKLGRPEPRPVTDRHGGRTYEVLWRAAIRANPHWVLITSFNEWHEGSEIEPSLEHGDRELKATRRYATRFVGMTK